MTFLGAVIGAILHGLYFLLVGTGSIFIASLFLSYAFPLPRVDVLQSGALAIALFFVCEAIDISRRITK